MKKHVAFFENQKSPNFFAWLLPPRPKTPRKKNYPGIRTGACIEIHRTTPPLKTRFPQTTHPADTSPPSDVPPSMNATLPEHAWCQGRRRPRFFSELPVIFWPKGAKIHSKFIILEQNFNHRQPFLARERSEQVAPIPWNRDNFLEALPPRTKGTWFSF